MTFFEILNIIMFSMAPVLELRGSIPYGILVAKLPWTLVFAVAVLSNFVVAPLAYIFLDKFVHFFFFMKWFERLYHSYVEKAQRKVKKHVEKYGVFGLTIFIGVPLPGSGVWTGALAAYILGMSKKQLAVSAFFGVLIAGAIVTAVVLSGSNAFKFLINKYGG